MKHLVLACLLVACADEKRVPPLGEDPNRHLTESECEAAVDHATALLDADPAGEDLAAQMRTSRADHVAACVKTGTLRDFRCLLGSHDLTELGRCPMPGR